MNVSGSMPVPPMVYILEDNDPDIRNPPFEDRLTIINPADHTKVRTIAKFGICESIGAAKRLVAKDGGLECLIVDMVSNRLVKYDFTRDEVSVMMSRSMNSIYFSENGEIYGLTDGTIFGNKVLKMDQSGNIIKETSYGGFDIAVDDHDSIWIVGANITRLNRNFNKQFSIDPVAWTALSVDFTSDGSAWICEGKHPEVVGSKDRLLKISPNGDIVKTIDFTTRPLCVSVDRNDDSLWLAIGNGLYKYDREGNLVKRVETQARWTVKVNQTDGSVWVAGFGDVKHYTRDGALIAAIPGFSSSQAYMDFILYAPIRDTVAPVTMINIGSPQYRSDATTYVSSLTGFTLSASDDASGVKETKYRIDGGAWYTYSSTFTLFPYPDGSRTIRYYSIDKAGNSEVEKTLTVILDNSPPSITGASPTGSLTQYFGTTPVTFTVTVTDTGSGIKEVKLTVDGALQGTMTKNGDAYTKTFSIAEGSHTWSVEASDNVGNTATQKYTLNLQAIPIWMYAAIVLVVVVVAFVILFLRRKTRAPPTFPPPPPPPS